jgi:hypothetical protein
MNVTLVRDLGVAVLLFSSVQSALPSIEVFAREHLSQFVRLCGLWRYKQTTGHMLSFFSPLLVTTLGRGGPKARHA